MAAGEGHRDPANSFLKRIFHDSRGFLALILRAAPVGNDAVMMAQVFGDVLRGAGLRLSLGQVGAKV